MLTLAPALFANDLVGILGKNWDDRTVQQIFSSNYVRRFSTTVTVDFRKNCIASNSLYIVSHPSQNTNAFWDAGSGFPALPYIPYVEIETWSDSQSNHAEIVSSLEVFKSKFGDDLLPKFSESLRLPDRLMDYKQLGSGLGYPGLIVWLWNRAVIEEKELIYTDNHPDNGRISYTNGLINGIVNLWFDKESLYSIQYCQARADALPNDIAPISNTLRDLQFIAFRSPWVISVDTNAVKLLMGRIKERADRNLRSPPFSITSADKLKKRFDSNLRVCERGSPIYKRMLELGYALERERKYFGAPISSVSRRYSSADGAIAIDTSADVDLGIFSESISRVYIDIRKTGGSKNVLLPNHVVLPETPDECRKWFKCRYSQASQDGKQLILCCEEGTFLFVECKLTKVSYSQVHNSTKGIYSRDFY